LRVLREAVSVDTFGLYVFLIVCLAVEAIFIYQQRPIAERSGGYDHSR